MMQHIALVAVAITTASIAGTALGYWGISRHETKKVSRAYRLQAGADEHTESGQTLLQVDGIYRRVIREEIACTQTGKLAKRPQPRFWLLGVDGIDQLVKKAGLSGRIDQNGYARARKRFSLGFAAAGFVLGLLFSEMLAFLLLCVGFVEGFRLGRSALRKEIEARSAAVEQELSQLIEVLVLGLRSGLSFDRSLEFYSYYFSCGLSDLCARLQTQWNHGLIGREEGLRTIAESYDSSLLERIMESIIRSLRFGTSMAETLSNAGTEVRATRKTKLEEQVAKAPVKMLIPIGTLILPAMLIFILGPVILELIGGF